MSTVNPNPNDEERIRQARRDAEVAFTQGGEQLGRGADGGRSPEEIESEIRQTRAQMDGTLSRLQRKLSSKPNEVVDEFTENLTQAIVRNPVPTVLLGTGLLWMMGSFLIRHRVPVALVGSAVAWRKMYGPEEGHYPPRQFSDTQFQRDYGHPGASHGSGRGHRMMESLKERADSGRERLSATGQRLSERSAHMRSQFASAADSAKARAARLAETTRDRAGRMRSGTQSMANEQPIMLAALGLAAGAMLGALLPHTRREDQWMGEARDRVLDRTRDEMHEQMERGKEAAKSVAEAATDAAKEEAKRQRDSMTSGGESRQPGSPEHGGPTMGM